MNNRLALFLQAIRGPILLITIGVLFLLEQSNVAHFSQTWPLILIIFGVLKLVERMVVPAPYIPPPPPGTYPPGGYAR